MEKLEVRDFSRIKSMFLLIYIYGCYSKDEIIAKLTNVGKTKYNDEIKRLISMYGSDFFKNEKIDKKKRPNFSYDRYDNSANYLIKSYKIKTYTKNEYVNYTYILQILNQELKEGLTLSDILNYINSFFDNDDYINLSSLNRHCKDLLDIGFIKKQMDKYLISDNFLDKLNEEELNTLIQTLYFYRGVAPLSSQAMFTIETLKEYLNDKFYKNDDFENNVIKDNSNVEDIYIYKNVFLNNILNENDIYNILYAINNNNKLKIIFTIKNKEFEIITVPLKIISEYKDGRQYLLCYDITKNCPNNIFIDNIIKSEILEDKFDVKEFQSTLDLIEKSYSMTQLYDLDDPLSAKPILVEVMFSIEEEQYNFIKSRVLNTKRHGIIEEISNTQFLYKIEVLSPNEMIPYIRSFGKYAKVIPSKNHNLYEKINEDWSNLKEYYGII